MVVLRPGPLSAAVVRLSPSAWYPYRPFNCSLKVEAGEGLDGVTAVVEEMDLRQHEDDARQPGMTHSLTDVFETFILCFQVCIFNI